MNSEGEFTPAIYSIPSFAGALVAGAATLATINCAIDFSQVPPASPGDLLVAFFLLVLSILFSPLAIPYAAPIFFVVFFLARKFNALNHLVFVPSGAVCGALMFYSTGMNISMWAFCVAGAVAGFAAVAIIGQCREHYPA